ncbi:MCP four helix bundle domain-containing protein [Roseivirga spongicola]|uniref:MCP four helix bundle domain-containing protein n=1 Tax=Roseivirga spongicola TaxID=333140 RepID=UPI002AC8C7A8|nr:MCP four helix bundle domain-containing protein [Roseivirga spongicola]WPZ08908.1 MCP four helix bundle domain-containing protein [Roseivirga spongicola]
MASISKKLKWTAALLIVFLLIIATNLVDRQHFRRVKESVVAMYEDRLVVKDLIFELKLLVDQKKLALLTENEEFFADQNEQVNDSIDALVERFYATQLTAEERDYLNAFVEKTETLRPIEERVYTDPQAEEQLAKSLHALESDLYVLSKIQLSEGKVQLMKASKSVNAMDYLTNLELIALIVIAVFVIFIWVYNPKSSLSTSN